MHRNLPRVVPIIYSRSCLHVLFYFFSAGFQNMDLGTKLTVKNATDAKRTTNSASRRTESTGRRPGPRFGQNPRKKVKTLFGLSEQSWVLKLQDHRASRRAPRDDFWIQGCRPRCGIEGCCAVSAARAGLWLR